MIFQKPELVENRVVVRHDDPDYGPYVIRAERPTGFRAAWRVLTGKYEPTVTLDQRYTVAGFNKMLKRAYGDDVRRALDESSSPLIFPIRKRES